MKTLTESELAAHDKALRRKWVQESTEDVIAHDEALEKALREQIVRDLMEKLPRIPAETSGDSFGWLSDGLYKDAEADSMDSEVYVRDGGLDLDQIAEYAARIVRGK